VHSENVLGDVRCPAECITTVADAHDRDGGFWRDSLDVTTQVDIEHGVTDDHDSSAASGREQRCEALA